jgi:N-acetylglutamate synthase-like GNAT family acetyltransferase
LENIVIRQADKHDAQILFELNEEFNEKGINSINHIISSLENNKQEFVCVVELSNDVVGFVVCK